MHLIPEPHPVLNTLNKSTPLQFLNLFNTVFCFTDTCKFDFNVRQNELEIKSPGYPNNYEANLTCEYYLTTLSRNKIIQLAISELSSGTGDVLGIYDTTDNSLITSLTGQQEYIETAPFNSSSLKIVFKASSSVSTARRYAFVFKEVAKGMRL